MPEIISRKEAKARGLKRYFTGKQCHRGHLAERYVSVAACCECQIDVRRAAGMVPRQIWLESLGNKFENRWKRSRAYCERHRKKINQRNIERVRKGRLALKALEELGIKV